MAMSADKAGKRWHGTQLFSRPVSPCAFGGVAIASDGFSQVTLRLEPLAAATNAAWQVAGDVTGSRNECSD
jgi:hypothetical protein